MSCIVLINVGKAGERGYIIALVPWKYFNEDLIVVSYDYLIFYYFAPADF
jgi:hypothetical protein